MQEPSSLPVSFSSAFSREAQLAREIELPQPLGASTLSCGGSPALSTNPHGLYGFSETESGCARSTESLGGAAAVKLPSQSILLRLSQYMRWTRGGVVVERHVASTRIVSTGGHSAEGSDWIGRAECQVAGGYCGLSSGGGRSPGMWDRAEGPPNGSRVLPAASSHSTASSRIVKGSHTGHRAQSAKFVRKLEVLEEGYASTYPVHDRGGGSNSTSSFSCLPDLEQTRVYPLGPMPLESTSQREFEIAGAPRGSNTAARPCSSSSSCTLLPKQQTRPPTCSEELERSEDGDRLRKSLGLASGQTVRRGSGFAGDSISSRRERQKQAHGALGRRRSVGTPVDLSTVRTVKGPLSRAKSSEPGIRTQNSKKVTARDPTREVYVNDAKVHGSSTRLSAAFGDSAASKANSSGSVQSFQQTIWGGSDRRSRHSSSSFMSARSCRGAAFGEDRALWSPQGRRNMSRTEAYFGRVPGGSADFQRLLDFRGEGTQPPPARQGGGTDAATRTAKDRQSSNLIQRQSTEPVGQAGRETFQEGNAGKVKAREKKEDSKKKRSDRHEKKQRSKSRSIGGRVSPLEDTEAASAVRAMEAAEASAAAAAAARAETAGPVPAWRLKQMELAAKEQTGPQSLTCTLRKRLSLPLSMFAKVKAKFARSKSCA